MNKLVNLIFNFSFIATVSFRISHALLFPERIQETCRLDEFHCANGKCIQGQLLCDGKKDCEDGSDETRNECLKPEIICPTYAFRCSYGACVDGDIVCNGVDDCIDRSDETSAQCTRDSSKNVTTTQTSSTQTPSCRTNQFRCENGQCIDDSRVCDGLPDCADKSDETSSVCRSVRCEGYSFHCAYGACIDSNLKCNGVRNCADGSDELYSLCGKVTQEVPGRIPSSPKPVTPTNPSNDGWEPPRITSTESPLTFTQNPLRKYCSPLRQPQNGKWKLHKSHCQYDDHCDAQKGAIMEPGSHLVYSCNSGYKLNGTVDVFCGSQGKWSTQPECIEIRCEALSSQSTSADCTYDDKWISCSVPVLPQTVARVSCRNNYRRDVTDLGLQRDTVRCNSDGEWQPKPIRCIPDCGVRSTSLSPLIVNGRRPNITEFPWHATLYESDSSGKKKFICGATIIQDDLLITAAHCIYNEQYSKVENPEKYFVATGNIFRDYESPLHDMSIVQKRKVKKIFINCNYLGADANYERDIAILQIDRSLTFKSFLVPICLDTTIHDQTAIDVGKVGIVAGFGRTESGPSSGILLSLSVPVVPLSQCTPASISADAEKFITIDKFCAGYTNGSSVCEGDSGGGLAFSDQGRWYLRGIVSVGIGSKITSGQRTCNNNLYSLYTKISSHISWIQDIIFKLKTQQNIPSCQYIS